MLPGLRIGKLQNETVGYVSDQVDNLELRKRRDRVFIQYTYYCNVCEKAARKKEITLDWVPSR